jgi:hypothetical protein
MTLNRYEREFFAERQKSSDKWEHYFEIYDDLLGKYYDNDVTYVEIGVQNGGGLEIARKLFSRNSKIIGVDVDPTCLKLKTSGLADEIIIGDQSSERTHESIISTTNRSIDVVIDDGSHIQSHMITTFIRLFPYLNEGGIYIIEDTHTNYSPEHQKSYFGIGLYDYFRAIVERLNLPFLDPASRQAFKTPRDKRTDPNFGRGDQFLSQIYRVSFFNSVIAVEKKALQSPFRVRM